MKLFRNELAELVDAERYQREIATLQIEHPNLVRYIDSGEVAVAGGELHWLAMELLVGDTEGGAESRRAVGSDRPRAEIARQSALGLVGCTSTAPCIATSSPANIHIGTTGRSSSSTSVS